MKSLFVSESRLERDRCVTTRGRCNLKGLARLECNSLTKWRRKIAIIGGVLFIPTLFPLKLRGDIARDEHNLADEATEGIKFNNSICHRNPAIANFASEVAVGDEFVELDGLFGAVGNNHEAQQ